MKTDLTQEEHLELFGRMATKDFNAEIDALLRIRSPLLYVTTNEERRLLDYFKHLSAAKGYRVYSWDCFVGLIDVMTGQPTDDFVVEIPTGEEDDDSSGYDMTDPTMILQFLHSRFLANQSNAKAMKSSGCRGEIFILSDYYYYFDPLDYRPDVERAFKQIAQITSPTTVVVTGPVITLTPSLESDFVVLDFPYPNEDEIADVLDRLVESVLKQVKGTSSIKKELEKNRDQLIRAAVGLTLKEIKTAFSKSIAQDNRLDVKYVLEEKKQIIRKKGYLEYFEPKVTIDDVGGLQNMIDWFKVREIALSPQAIEYGLKVPRGVLIIGMPGCVLEDTKIKIRKISKEGKLKLYKK
jgi:hypothetical protein